MNAFGIQIESTVQVTPYDEYNEFLYKEIQRIPQNANGRISFSVLINIKQAALSDEGKIDVIFARILDDKNASPQKFYKITLGEIPLDGSLAQDSTENSYVFRSDPWQIRKTIRWNCNNVPVKGNGHYAVALMIDENNDPQNRIFLDCAYFEVI